MSIGFNPKEGLIIVPTRLFGPVGDAIVQLALDTGATGSIVNWDIAVLLGYDPAIAEDRVQITTGSGVEFASRIKVMRIEALGRAQEHFPLSLPYSSSYCRCGWIARS
jgi:hypothetical protein